jgi:glucose/mannose transport system substrate-binding protein
MRPRPRLATWFTLAAAAAAAACAPDRPQPSDDTFISWWSKPGERDALFVLMDKYQALHSDQIPHFAPPYADSDDARAAIRMQWKTGRPPESFQANGGQDVLFWVLYNTGESQLNIIDDLASAWRDTVPGPVLDAVSCRGHVYAVPLDIHRLNTLFYNQQIFADHNLAVPTTLDELFAAAETLKSAGVTPFALSSEPWTLSLLLFENLLVAEGGATYYNDYFLGRLPSGDGPQVAAALDDLARVLSYTTIQTITVDWGAAVSAVIHGAAAMTVMGDWDKGYAVASGLIPDGGPALGQAPMPGTVGKFVFTTDTFGLPKGVLNPTGARYLLELAGSKVGQDIFNPVKGSISPRSFKEDSSDSTAQATIDDFRMAAAQQPSALLPATSIAAPQEYTNEVNAVIGDFAFNTTDPNLKGNPSRVLATLHNWYDLLGPSLCQQP